MCPGEALVSECCGGWSDSPLTVALHDKGFLFLMIQEGKNEMSEPDKDKQAEVPPSPQVVETEEYVEYGTFNGAVRRDHK